ncbi:MAG TPA: acyl-CoA dehydrogenase family protein [Methylomirabilota bacterium]|nr:acyl-CoA dehydrogenase family protein [Methylomirabilota bacterium]
MTRTASRSPHPIVTSVREFVEREVRPVAADLEHADAYPHELVARLKALGLFGSLIPATYGGLGLDVSTYARVIEELCRGWMSLAGVINSHTMAALIVLHHGTEEQRGRLLPRLASGLARGGLCLTEPHAGSDVQAIRTVARRDGDRYLISGSKMFVTNGREGNAFALLALTDPAASPRHKGMSCFIVEKGAPGLQVVKSIAKLGYKGVDTAELLFDNFPCSAANLVGGVEGRGFKHVMSGLETGRINIAARAVGVAQAGFEAALGAGAPGEAAPALADIATRVEAARLLTYWSAGMKDRGERCDLEAGMAKLYASESAQEVAVESMRLLGPRGQAAASPVERLYRDTPLMIIGEGTNEIQRLIIARNLLERYGERLGALTSREGEPEERRHMVLAVRQLVEKDIGPAVEEYERAGRRPDPLVARLIDLGLLGALAAPEHGGLGLDLLTYTMIVEELARGWTTVAALLHSQSAAAWLLARFGTPAERERWLPAMTRGERWGAVAAAGTVTALHDGRGWVLDGHASLVDHAERADFFIVFASTRDGVSGCFLAERSASGLSVGVAQPTLGGRGLGAADLTLAGAHGATRLGATPEEQGQVSAAAAAIAGLGHAAQGVGSAQAAFEAALRYSQQRTAFGVPICQHQAIQLKLADMATRITASRLLTYRGAERLDADPGDDAGALMAGLDAAQTAYTVALESMRIHGGYGYTNEFPVERYYRDAARLLTAGPEAGEERRRLAARLLARAGR